MTMTLLVLQLICKITGICLPEGFPGIKRNILLLHSIVVVTRIRLPEKCTSLHHKLKSRTHTEFHVEEFVHLFIHKGTLRSYPFMNSCDHNLIEIEPSLAIKPESKSRCITNFYQARMSVRKETAVLMRRSTSPIFHPLLLPRIKRLKRVFCGKNLFQGLITGIVG